MVKSCWPKGCLVAKVAVEVFEAAVEEVRPWEGVVARAPQDPTVQGVKGGRAVAGTGVVLSTDGTVKVDIKGRAVTED